MTVGALNVSRLRGQLTPAQSVNSFDTFAVDRQFEKAVADQQKTAAAAARQTSVSLAPGVAVSSRFSGTQYWGCLTSRLLSDPMQEQWWRYAHARLNGAIALPGSETERLIMYLNAVRGQMQLMAGRPNGEYGFVFQSRFSFVLVKNDSGVFVFECGKPLQQMPRGLSGAPEEASMTTYRVGMGETPMQIATRLTGQPARAQELVYANRHKQLALTGGAVTFASLQAGEQINVPASWGLGDVGLGEVPVTNQNVPCSNWIDVGGRVPQLTFNTLYSALQRDGWIDVNNNRNWTGSYQGSYWYLRQIGNSVYIYQCGNATAPPPAPKQVYYNYRQPPKYARWRGFSGSDDVGLGAASPFRMPPKIAVGVGATSPFALVGGAEYIEPALAIAACTGGWRLRNDGTGGQPMTQQTVIASRAFGSGTYYVLYENNLYRINPTGGGAGSLYVCNSFDKSKLVPAPPPPPQPAPPQVTPAPPGGGGVVPIVIRTTDTNTTTEKSSMLLPIGLIALVGITGLAAAWYLTKGSTSTTSITTIRPTRYIRARARRRSSRRRYRR